VSRGGRTLPIALGALLAMLAASSAQAGFQSCRDLRGAQCARVAVPLDRSGGLPGEIGLHVVRLKARRATDRALVYLSGGPGGAGVPEFRAALADRPIRRLRSRYHLATFDQRGTGRSGLLRCRAMERDVRLRSTGAAARCSQALGPRRAFYTTRETVEDLEAVRVALGAERLLLYGVSYGTKVALAYARAYPERVERMLLDSVVDPDDRDEFGVEPYQNLGATLRGLCPERCRGVTGDPVGDIAALTERLRERPVAGVTPLRVSDVLFDADYAPELRAGVPAAVLSLLRYRNPGPLARLIRASRAFATRVPAREFSAARYATTCEETPLPWERGAPFERRVEQLEQRAAALGPDAFRPFDLAVMRADEIDLCLRWPEATAAPALRGEAYPSVPALLLQGGEDLRTPPSTSARVAATLAQFDLEGQRAVFPRFLARGDKQKVCIASIVAMRPRILLLDEPTEGLAPLLVERVRGVVEQLRQLGLTVLLVEQNLGFALAVADRVAVMHRGTIDTVAESAAFSDVEALANLVLGGSARAIRSGPVRSSTGGHAGP